MPCLAHTLHRKNFLRKAHTAGMAWHARPPPPGDVHIYRGRIPAAHRLLPSPIFNLNFLVGSPEHALPTLPLYSGVRAVQLATPCPFSLRAARLLHAAWALRAAPPPRCPCRALSCVALRGGGVTRAPRCGNMSRRSAQRARTARARAPYCAACIAPRIWVGSTLPFLPAEEEGKKNFIFTFSYCGYS